MATTNKINIADNIIETIGRTPLVRLNQGKMLAPEHVADVVLKLEF